MCIIVFFFFANAINEKCNLKLYTISFIYYYRNSWTLKTITSEIIGMQPTSTCLYLLRYFIFYLFFIFSFLFLFLFLFSFICNIEQKIIICIWLEVSYSVHMNIDYWFHLFICSIFFFVLFSIAWGINFLCMYHHFVIIKLNFIF